MAGRARSRLLLLLGLLALQSSCLAFRSPLSVFKRCVFGLFVFFRLEEGRWGGFCACSLEM
jgi:hypothetical protein